MTPFNRGAPTIISVGPVGTVGPVGPVGRGRSLSSRAVECDGARGRRPSPRSVPGRMLVQPSSDQWPRPGHSFWSPDDGECWSVPHLCWGTRSLSYTRIPAPPSSTNTFPSQHDCFLIATRVLFGLYTNTFPSQRKSRFPTFNSSHFPQHPVAAQPRDAFAAGPTDCWATASAPAGDAGPSMRVALLNLLPTRHQQRPSTATTNSAPRPEGAKSESGQAIWGRSSINVPPLATGFRHGQIPSQGLGLLDRMRAEPRQIYPSCRRILLYTNRTRSISQPRRLTVSRRSSSTMCTAGFCVAREQRQQHADPG